MNSWCEASIFVLFSGASVLLSAKSGTSELSEKSEFPRCNYGMDVGVNAIYSNAILVVKNVITITPIDINLTLVVFLL